MDIVIASHNKGKIAEFSKALGTNHNILSIGDFTSIEPDENGKTLSENSQIKATYAFNITKKPSIADDTGLFVDALSGRPGIYSARYGNTDKERVDKLLKELDGLPKEKRTANFTCAITYIDEHISFTVEGKCDGYIAFSPSGNGGFGYDPIFVPFIAEKSFSDLGVKEKNKISHRGKAIQLLIAKLKELKII